MHISITKMPIGWASSDPQTVGVWEKMRIGEVLHGKFSKMRHPEFHKKYFSLLRLGFDYWEPGEITCDHGVPEKNFDQYREDLIILAGYYIVTIRLDGSTRITAKSISFAKMEQPEFEALYEATLTALMKRVDTLKDMTAEEINVVVNKMLDYA